MSYAKVIADWVEQFGDPQALGRWISPSDLGDEHGLCTAGRQVIDKFLAIHSSYVHKVVEVHPEFLEWYTNRGADLISSMASVRVRTETELVDLIGLVDALAYQLEHTSGVEDLWLWLSETVADLKRHLEVMGLLEKAFVASLWLTVSASVSVDEVSFSMAAAGRMPAAVRLSGKVTEYAA